MSDTPAQPLIHAQNLQSGFGKRTVLHSINFALRPGEFVGLVGPNGSGKTTLLHSLTGHIHPTAGEVQLCSQPVRSLNRAEIARQIAFVPQFTETVYGFTVEEMVLMGRYPYSGFGLVDSASHAGVVIAALQQFDIAHLRTRTFNELSGGERQLVLLARALMQRASILMMDEPLTALDLRHQFEVMQGLRDHSRRSGNAALATFHDLPTAARWCDRLVLLKAGEIKAGGPPREVITPENLRAVYDINAQVAFNETGEMLLTVQGVMGAGVEKGSVSAHTLTAGQ